MAKKTAAAVKQATASWKTTLSGILALAVAGLQIYQDPSTVANPQTLATIIGGVGLIAAKDSNVSGK